MTSRPTGAPAPMGARGLLSLLFHGEKAIDVVNVSLWSGLLRRLDAGPVSVGELASGLEMVPGRLWKLLDCLESLGLVRREQDDGDMLAVRYASVVPLEEDARAVVGDDSIERDRDRQPWRALHGRLPEVLRGGPGIPGDQFAWPPSTPEQIAHFEASMALGVAPIAESFCAARDRLWPAPRQGERVRVLDVGGGDGTLARHIAEDHHPLHVDVLELPGVEPLARARFSSSPAASRLGFVAADFLREPFPEGYDAICFVRVLHDWPTDTARALLEKAHAALPRGGSVLICEEFRTPERLAVQFFWSYFLIGVDACVSRLREESQYARMLEKTGFDPPERARGAFDILVARRA